ncbi:Na+/H+ antiporter NhaC [Arundinibacter roseus]|uniref:Na+/H+ antiporter NhaC n=1 Tax=Arundinibacter roseus TaxID=2070510 RepID=A0A4V2XA15_9BACT|nr:Na+/H+ antiporter NhaC [Arundinibacter roseus]TDB65925.1 Na+/H+ antiporter NhaC [Arundinibacter roseus]
MKRTQISLLEALIPIVFLMALLAINVFTFEDSLGGPNQFALLLAAAVATLVGYTKGVSYKDVIGQISRNIESTSEAIIILLLVGSLAGTWLVSGVVPAMVYYGIQILHPSFFLPACVVICAIVSVATGSSWTTSATIGIALMGIGNALGISEGIVAGAVISGAYFGDKMSPLSDTTNLAPAMAGTDLYTHIRYMAFTTVPSIVLALVIFVIITFNLDTASVQSTTQILSVIESKFVITPWLFLVPITVIGLILRRTPPITALLAGALLGGVFALIFQPQILTSMAGVNALNATVAFKSIMTALTSSVSIETTDASLNDLFSSGGMAGMLNTIWLILCAMTFGGAMEASGALEKLTKSILKVATSPTGLFTSTVSTCILFNLTASDQYLAIVVPGKMFAKAYKAKGLAPENLSRSLEDSGTVTSVLVPWNTCGAYQSGVLGVATLDYLPYAFFNIISPIMTLTFAWFGIKIRRISQEDLDAASEPVVQAS